MRATERQLATGEIDMNTNQAATKGNNDNYTYHNCTATCPNQIVAPPTTAICGRTCDCQTKLDGQHPGLSHHCSRCGNW